MTIFSQMCRELPLYRELSGTVKNGYTPCGATGVSNIHKAHIAAELSKDKPVLLICDDEASGLRLVNDMNEMAGAEIACLFPARDFNFAYLEGMSREYEHKRIEALSKLMSGKCHVCVASVEACMQGIVPRETLKQYSILLRTGGEINIPFFSQKLIASGYTKTDRVEGQAQFAVRGSIIDIFPVQDKNPVRIELWGDEVDMISYFDAETQRRTDGMNEIEIFPALEIIFPSDEDLLDRLENLSKAVRGKNTDKIRKHISRDAELVESGITLTNLDKYYSLAYDKVYTIFDYFNEGICVFSEYQNCSERAKAVLSQLSEDIKLLYEDGILFKRLEGFFIDFAELTAKALNLPAVFLDTFMRGNNGIKFKKLINSDCRQTGTWGGNISHLVEELQTLCENDYCTVVFAGSEKTVPIIVSDLREQNIPALELKEDAQIIPRTVYVRTGSLSGGFDYPDIKCAAITQMKAMNAKKKSAKKRKKGEEIKSLSDISAGDLVVHSMYGIGKFAGIKNLETNGVTKDYITIKYAGSDVLYVPVTQLDLVSRYIGPKDDSGVKLNKLNSMEWHRTRSRVKSAVKDMAEELTKLYAQRQMAKGFAFSKDNDWQNDFEERFDYQETDDQLRSIQEIKEDMQKPTPMDRLLCGDVGFGKTEVALRAAFKCAADGKQCAILVPTTILAYQHYRTILKRFDGFPVEIEMLSRFRTPKEQEKILKNLKRGSLDIIVGTHRLVSKDVKFKDLGLLIVDEEQRFGVAQKEKLKELFPTVDVLTLSATPIPRTLNMAMTGIRDMSVIEEAPQDRYPVQTYVIEHDIGILCEAMEKELRRGGQVYYLHNRVESIESTAAKIKEMMPSARIAVAHGRMGEEELSEIWRDLLEGDIDILVCTTIIETGVDVPNCNTLIIEDADRLGLAQLHQIRGRVGRSTRRASAYFTFKRGKELSEIANRRLSAIREYTEFGSGFKIAMRDLEIRGAGNVLGAQQHGHMEAVCYDMYLQLLGEAVEEEKGEKPISRKKECLIDMQIDAHIPDNYIKSIPQRLAVYRRIADIKNTEDAEDVKDELRDRFGEIPQSVQGLIDVSLLRNTAAAKGIYEIGQKGNSVILYVNDIDTNTVLNLSSMMRGRVSIMDYGKKHIAVKIADGQSPLDTLKEIFGYMVF